MNHETFLIKQNKKQIQVAIKYNNQIERGELK